jgi:hypothetical protein
MLPVPSVACASPNEDASTMAAPAYRAMRSAKRRGKFEIDIVHLPCCDAAFEFLSLRPHSHMLGTSVSAYSLRAQLLPLRPVLTA